MKFIQLLLLLSLPLLCYSQKKEKHQIRFFKGSWEEALAKSKQTGKLIFVDAYTTWCGPCKRMEKNVFTDKKVANYYNSKFINVRMDMERGEGLAFAKKYTVRVYPNLLYIDGEGKVMHRRAGFVKAKDFIGLGSLAQNPQYRLEGMWKQFDAGERSPDFLTSLTKMAYAAKDDSHRKVVEEYLRVQADWGTNGQRQYIMDFLDDTNTAAYDYLLAHKGDFEEQFGASKVDATIRKIIFNSIRGTKQESSLDHMRREFTRAYPDGSGEPYILRFERDYYKRAKDYQKFAETSIQYHKIQENNPLDLNNSAWHFYELIDDKKLLKHALGWIDTSIQINEKYYNLDTKAHLLYKLGKYKKAEKIAQKAIEVGKIEDTDVSGSERLLELIKQ